MKAFLIEVDFDSGQRAGGINPKDRKLRTHPTWQDTDTGLEVRLVVNGDGSPYDGLDGVTPLEGETAIDEALKRFRSERYVIRSETLMVESARQKDIDLSDISAELDDETFAREMYRRGALGVKKVTREPVSANTMARRYNVK